MSVTQIIKTRATENIFPWYGIRGYFIMHELNENMRTKPHGKKQM